MPMARARLPPLNAIKAFESAARLGSFTRAAEELSVTHGALSRQIRLLEEWLGTSLFLRTSRNAVPTRAGTDLLAEAGPALDRLASAALRVRSGKALGVLHISALPTFAMRWLIPRLPELQREYPALETRIVTASTPAEQFGMDVDVVVSGPARQPGWIGSRFLGEAYLPLLSPGDETAPTALAGGPRAAHAAPRGNATPNVAAVADRRRCPGAKAGARSGLRAFLLRDPSSNRRAWGGDGPVGARQR